MAGVLCVIRAEYPLHSPRPQPCRHVAVTRVGAQRLQASEASPGSRASLCAGRFPLLEPKGESVLSFTGNGALPFFFFFNVFPFLREQARAGWELREKAPEDPRQAELTAERPVWGSSSETRAEVGRATDEPRRRPCRGCPEARRVALVSQQLTLEQLRANLRRRSSRLPLPPHPRPPHEPTAWRRIPNRLFSFYETCWGPSWTGLRVWPGLGPL